MILDQIHCRGSKALQTVQCLTTSTHRGMTSSLHRLAFFQLQTPAHQLLANSIIILSLWADHDT